MGRRPKPTFFTASLPMEQKKNVQLQLININYLSLELFPGADLSKMNIKIINLAEVPLTL